MPSSGSYLALACRFSKRSVRGRVSNPVVGIPGVQDLSLFVNPMPPRTTEKSYRPRVSDRTMVDTRIRLALSRVSESSGIALWLSLFRNDLRTVLAVKGPLRRAYRRALDRSGPFRRRHFH